jgi:hypothetical protein
MVVECDTVSWSKFESIKSNMQSSLNDKNPDR